MEELKKETITNKSLSEKISYSKDSEMKNEEIEKPLIDKNEKENLNDKGDEKLKENNSEQKEEKKTDLSKESEQVLDPKKELEKIKLSHMKEYSVIDILKKSLVFSTKSIKLPLFNIFKKMVNQILDLRIPIIYGQLLNSIIKEKNYVS